MVKRKVRARKPAIAVAGMVLLLAVAWLSSRGVATAGEARSIGKGAPPEQAVAIPASELSLQPQAACSGGPTFDGITLDECFVESFTVGGANKSVTAWYTKDQTPVTRVENGTTYTLVHGLDNDGQAEDVAHWARQAWEVYYLAFNHHPYDTGCNGNINIWISHLTGPSYAAMPVPGSCTIDINAAEIRAVNMQGAVYHEMAHYLQYSYDDGCLDYIRTHYGALSGPDALEYVEGEADMMADGVDAVADAGFPLLGVQDYYPYVSFFDHGYFNVGIKYYIEQVGTEWTPADPWHHLDAVRAHYEACDAEDDLYVLDTLIPTLTGGRLTDEKLFLNFFAANWTKDWADPVTQPELIYWDDDVTDYGPVELTHDDSLGTGGAIAYSGEDTPADWAGRYYQVRPDPSCDYVSMAVDGAAGARLGINLMAAHTAAPSRVVRWGWIGEDLARTVAAAGVHDRLAVAVNAFDTPAHYSVAFECVTPALEILEPRTYPDHILVGSPATPSAFLARFTVTSGGAPVRGLPESSFTADAEGDDVKFVPGSFQEINGEYWAILVPPAKPVGTSLVDLELCLDNTICASQHQALMYGEPGKTDFALVFDASNSMADEDVPGEGTRFGNARKAGGLLADLLSKDDRILVTDFSAYDNPPDCGLPYGDGDCELDLRTYLPRTDVVIPDTIDVVHDAIDMITPRGWTPIGAALDDARIQLQATPPSDNPKVIVLLSDGEENVRPLYADVRKDLMDSGIKVDTIGFGLPGEVGEATLAQIASDTRGVFRFVPTVPTFMGQITAEEKDALQKRGVPPEILARLDAIWQPGPLALDNVYDYYEALGQDAARLFAGSCTGLLPEELCTAEQYVESGVTLLRLVAAGKQGDGLSMTRNVQVLPPGADPVYGWMTINPPAGALPAGWSARHSAFDDTILIDDPAAGDWQIRVMGWWLPGAGAQSGSAAPQQAPAVDTFDFFLSSAVQSEYRLNGRFLPPISNNQGRAGDAVPIVATLLTRDGALPGATVLAEVSKQGDSDSFLLLDDGAHADGQAGDGIYGALYRWTDVGGAYNVHLLAWWDDPLNPGHSLNREWLGAFWIEGPQVHDQDSDLMPDGWETRCGLDVTRDDHLEDPDHDGLINMVEFQEGTLPLLADTDGGGEWDTSELAGERDPLNPADDRIPPLAHLIVRPLNERIRVEWSHPGDYLNMRAFVSTDPDELGTQLNLGSEGVYTIEGLSNDQTYYVTLQGANRLILGGFSHAMPVTPRSDPDAPKGIIRIDDGAPRTESRQVVLNLGASDTPVDLLSLQYNTVSGGIEVRIGNDPSLAGAAWEPLVSQKPWPLQTCTSGICRVYAQFRDAAGNESYVVWDDVLLDRQFLFLPLVLRSHSLD